MGAVFSVQLWSGKWAVCNVVFRLYSLQEIECNCSLLNVKRFTWGLVAMATLEVESAVTPTRALSYSFIQQLRNLFDLSHD